MKITWNGTASVMLEAAGEKLLIDPFVELKGGTNPNTLEDYLDFDTILITHGHFDHLYFVPELLDETGATVLCTKTPAQTLERYSDKADTVAQIGPGMAFSLGVFEIHTYQGRHIHFGPAMAASALAPMNLLRRPASLPFLAWANHAFQENGETLVYEIVTEGKHLLVMGSLGLATDVDYPQGADLLLLPYQGSLHPEKEALQVIERLLPRKVMLTHFDDAFPPISKDVDTRPLCRMMKERFPDIAVVKPKAGKAIRL